MTAYSATNSVPLEALPTTSGVVQKFRAAATNDGPSTYAPDGLAATPIFGLGGQQLQGDEIVEGGIATLVSFIGPLVDSGSLCWVLLECDGGAQQVAPATQGEHAVQLQQLQNAVAGVSSGRLLRRSVYVNVAGALQVSVNGSAFAAASSTFDPLPGTNAVDVQVQGAGGSGGGAAATAVGQMSAGVGGGGGGYARKWLTNDFAGLSVAVGAGGAAVTGGVNGNKGGDSSFGTTVKATGGAGGLTLPASAPTNSPFGSASGGAGTGGDINSSGGQGLYCQSFAAPVSGGGGASFFGAGGYYTNGTAGSSAFLNGGSFGSGGAGAAATESKPAQTGGSGMSGVVIVDEYSA